MTKAYKPQRRHKVLFEQLNKLPAVPLTAAWPHGIKVYPRGSQGAGNGRTTGASSVCTLEGCKGVRITTVWPGGHFTRPCSEGLEEFKDGVRII